MISADKIRRENEEILDFTTALAVLIEHRELHGNQVVCGLLERFSKLVHAHLQDESRSLYQDLLTKPDPQTRTVLSQFLDNTEELKRLCSKYNRKWCNHPASPQNDVERFLSDTRDIFQLVRQRIEMENERLLPLLAA